MEAKNLITIQEKNELFNSKITLDSCDKQKVVDVSGKKKKLNELQYDEQ